ncbi:MAG: CRTAC1 family protein [Alphaproteobacteria bacterium]|nr:CRTAC1 family protein [Alphaproteobacteria bacterium]
MRLTPLCVLLLASACHQTPSDTDDTDTDVPDTDTDGDTDTVDTDVVDSDTDVVETDTEVVETDTDTDTDVDTDLPLATSLLTQTLPLVCLDPENRPPDPFVRLDAFYPVAPRPFYDGGGAVTGDFDGNGLVDVVAISWQRPIYYRQGPIGSFNREILANDPTLTNATGFFGGSAVDVDDDGDLDLMVTARGRQNILFVNDGTGHFVDGTVAAGLAVVPATHHTTGASWSDIDGDGDLDLFLAGHGFLDETRAVADQGPADPSFLFANQGDGTFVDVSNRLPAGLAAGFSLGGAWFDADGDGDDDLYVINDFGDVLEPNRIVWNDAGTFHLDSGATGLDLAMASTGLGVGDIDGDGDEDLAISGRNGHTLLRSTGSGWVDSATDYLWIDGIDQTRGWGAQMFDWDNDGRMDIGTAYGAFDSPLDPDVPTAQADGLFLQQTPGLFLDAAPLIFSDDRGPTRSVVAADLDGNGWLDTLKVGLDGTAFMDLAHCGDESWITVDLIQDAPNVFGVGATITAEVGATTVVRRIRAGGTGWGTGDGPQAHLGLGMGRRIDRLTIAWPDGHVDVYEDLLTRIHVRIDRRGRP